MNFVQTPVESTPKATIQFRTTIRKQVIRIKGKRDIKKYKDAARSKRGGKGRKEVKQAKRNKSGGKITSSGQKRPGAIEDTPRVLLSKQPDRTVTDRGVKLS